MGFTEPQINRCLSNQRGALVEPELELVFSGIDRDKFVLFGIAVEVEAQPEGALTVIAELSAEQKTFIAGKSIRVSIVFPSIQKHI